MKRLSDLLPRGRRSYWIVARGFVLNVRPALIGWCWTIPGEASGWSPLRVLAEIDGLLASPETFGA